MGNNNINNNSSSNAKNDKQIENVVCIRQQVLRTTVLSFRQAKDFKDKQLELLRKLEGKEDQIRNLQQRFKVQIINLFIVDTQS